MVYFVVGFAYNSVTVKKNFFFLQPFSRKQVTWVLRVQAWKNLAKAALCSLFTLLAIPAVLLFPYGTTLLKEGLAFACLLPLIGSGFYLRKYRQFNAGLSGEKQVAKTLAHNLNNDYYLLNGVRVRGLGDIDHIVLGPNGVFVLETKNWSGKIRCNGDSWQRAGKPIAASPSRQAKTAALATKRLITASELWVEAVVVFTNRHADLQVTSPTCTILQLAQLPRHIAAYKSQQTLSQRQLEALAKQILKQK